MLKVYLKQVYKNEIGENKMKHLIYELDQAMLSYLGTVLSRSFRQAVFVFDPV